ncbi:intradiol ring-cleavage dioxygenase [Parahaliea maris]|uniref:Intradiol ring-cleavage dioxygenase n=1 Tax=Parahaliea maris TaxID=2716870 RepID=A0A5C8ZM53_9GAMM|nr:intradiol ring-cleavage dioxygenase [Parahaliea maris]TXS89538.1 intradiol ring-cleavage dioxygenase [Parahaliea maris]
MKTPPPHLNRRKLLLGMSASLSLAPFLSLPGCGGGSSGSNSGSTSTDETDTGTILEDQDSDSSDTSTGDSDWSAGGTAAMEADFPPADPFASGLGNPCTLTSDYTLGPCYFDVDDYQQDISEGEPGVPMALVLKLVDQYCEPIAGADIEVWFVNWEGLYSGNTDGSSNTRSFNSGYCTAGDQAALGSRWFRGVQTTDSNGLVYFKCCFPGWYASRTTHIHFKVVRNSSEALVSQFCFDDSLANEIYLNHAEYTGYAKDTDNEWDGVFGDDYSDYQFEVERQWDSSMLAYKAIQIL